MMRIQCDEINYGLVSYLWPDYRWVWYPYSPFIPETHLIVVCDKDADLYPSKVCIYLTKHNGTKVDSKQGMIDICSSKWGVNDKIQQILLGMEDSEFWEAIKYFWLMGTLPDNIISSEGASTVFHLFRVLFQSFGEAYKAYTKIGKNHQLVFSCLVTMMLKTQAELYSGSDFYKRVLHDNKPYFAHFRRCVINYIESSANEIDFLSFLFQCSQRRVVC